MDVLSRVPASVRGCVIDADALNALARIDWLERAGERGVRTDAASRRDGATARHRP